MPVPTKIKALDDRRSPRGPTARNFVVKSLAVLNAAKVQYDLCKSVW